MESSSVFMVAVASFHFKNEMTNFCYPTNHGLIESNENLPNYGQLDIRNEFGKAKTFQWINELTTFVLIIKGIK